MTDFTKSTLGNCTPPQILSLTYPLNDLSTIHVYDECGCEYARASLQYAYSLDNLCWSCYMSYEDALANTAELNQDFFVKIIVTGIISKVLIGDIQTSDYSTDLKGCFSFTASSNSGTFDPYADQENAISLAQQLAENVSQLVGIPSYYIKLKPNAGGKDLTFKEYALMNVDSIKVIKIIIQDNEMPSSKPEFNDFGLDWQTDWEVEVTKGSFATAFGNEAQPMEGDLVYIPMMKRMWMVNESYEEKKDGFMWIATTFKLALVKYQEKGSVDLGDSQTFVDSVVKAKYEDLFDEDEQTTLDSGEESTEAPRYAASTLYPVFESDATRKYITCDTVAIKQNQLYEHGALVADNCYEFLSNPSVGNSRIIYQNKYCGDELSLSFILQANSVIQGWESPIIQIGRFKIMISQGVVENTIWLSKNKNVKVSIGYGVPMFITLKISKALNLCEMFAYQYTYNKNIPIYKLKKQNYWFDIDNPTSSSTGKFDVEYAIMEKTTVELDNFPGWITNFKLFDLYNSNTSELLQMYPTHQHLLINDTVRRITDLPGVKPA